MFEKPNASDPQLIEAAADGNLNQVIKITELYNGDVNTINSFGQSPAYFAAKRNDLEMLEYLASRGADLRQGDYLNQAPIDWAMYNENQDMIDLITTNQPRNCMP